MSKYTLYSTCKKFLKRLGSFTILHSLLLLVIVFNSLDVPIAYGQLVKHVVLISLDGAKPNIYMDEAWPAPHLQHLKKEGVYAAEGVEGIFPSVTWPSHVSIITGAYPATTGIYYNQPFGSKSGTRYWYYSYIQSKTLWDAVRQAGMTSGAVWWPVTVGAPIDYNFPVLRAVKGGRENNLTVRYPYISPQNLLSDIEKKTGKQFTPASLEFKNREQGKFVATVTNYIIKTYKPNLIAVHFGGIDHAEHSYGIKGPRVRAAVAFTDSLVGTVLQAIKDAGIWKSTAIIITGDHGHINTKATFAPNVVLAKHGLITKYGWKAKFVTAGGSAFLYLKDKNDKAILDSVISIIKKTPTYQKSYFRILDRTTLDKMGVNPNVPLVLAMKAGITVRDGIKGKVFKITKGRTSSTHGYDPAYPGMHTIFIATGAGIGKHKNIRGMGIVDIAPLISKLLGLDFNAPDGQLIPEIISKNEKKNYNK